MSSTFVLKSETFEGPLSLLLSLIEKRKLHISEVSLASIADEYITHLEEVGKSEENLSEFLSVMSTLLLIKARSLLPGIQLSASEEEEIDELEENLRRYKALSRTAYALNKRLNTTFFEQVRGVVSREEKGFRPFKNLSASLLEESARLIIVRIPTLAEAYRKIHVEKKVRLETVIASMLERINTSFSQTFSSLTKDSEDRVSVVVSFLALLELIKNGVVAASQRELFGNIVVEKISVDIPRYGS